MSQFYSSKKYKFNALMAVQIQSIKLSNNEVSVSDFSLIVEADF